MAKSHSSEPPAEDAGGSEASADKPADGDPGQPWWSAGDEEFAGATPLFDGVKRPHPESEPPPPPKPDAVGTPIGEALKLAGAFMQWAEQSGLSDTIRELAAEAATALEDVGRDDGTSDDDADAQHPPTIHAVPLHTASRGPGEQPLLVCDYCPLCRGMEVMRTVQPQMSQGVAEAMASLTSALNYAVDGFVRRQRHRDQR